VTQTVQLASQEIAALGEGAGHIDGPLIAGQISRRLLLLHTILAETERRQPEVARAGRLAESRAILAAAQRQDRAATDEVLRQPSVGAWMTACLQHLRDPGSLSLFADDLGYFGGIVAVAAFRADYPFEVSARFQADGTLMLPTIGLVRSGQKSAWVRLRADAHSDQIELLEVEKCRIIEVDGNENDTDGWWPLRCLHSTVAGSTIRVYLDDIDPYRGRRLPAVTARLARSEVDHWQQQLDDAWTGLTRDHPDQAKALSVGMVSLVPLKPSSQAPSISATTRSAIGAAGITRPQAGGAFAESLVHEHQHSVLWALLDVVSLLDEQTTALFYAPWRSDPRPPRGLLHGAYAYLGLLSMWFEQQMSCTGSKRRMAQFDLALWRGGVKIAVDQLENSALLTDAGRTLVAGMRKTLGPLLDCPVDDDLQQLADQSSLDQRLGWRLRNLRPATSEVREWCDFWRRMGSRPSAGESNLVSGAQRFARSARLPLIRRQIADPEGFRVWATHALPEDDIARADLLWAAGDAVEAARLYRMSLTARNDDVICSWAGIALTQRQLNGPAAVALYERPELVCAVAECIAACTGKTPDPIELATWIAG
jgi:HEXXH motif-containing protein